MDNMPKLRFKEFTDEWKNVSLKSIGTFKKGKNLQKADINSNGNNECILYGELYTKYSEVINNIFSKTNANKNFIYSTNKDVLIPSSGETAEEIATASAIMKKGVILGGDINIFTTTEDNRFLAYFFRKNRLKLSKIAQGISVFHIYAEGLKNVKINLPILSEQTKIADFLSLIDERIARQEEKVNLLKEQKKGYLQKIFSKELKFKDENGNEYPKWEEKKLRDIAEVLGGYAFKSIDFTKEGIPVITIKNIKENITSNQEFDFYPIEDEKILSGNKEDILIALSGATTGKSGIVGEGNYYINQRVARIRHKENINYFIFAWLKTVLFEKELKKLLVAGAQPNLSIIDLKNVVLPFPSLPEQQKIAAFLSKQDEIIASNEEKLNLLKEQKQSLLQQMFV